MSMRKLSLPTAGEELICLSETSPHSLPPPLLCSLLVRADFVSALFDNVLRNEHKWLGRVVQSGAVGGWEREREREREGAREGAREGGRGM